MSHVVLAQDVLLGRRVALKRMNAGDDTKALLRLRREALIGASVSHPNLVSIYDIVAAGGGEYVIVMEYVEGETLREALASGKRLPVAKVLTILDGVAAGLDAIHAQRIVHRDVKPANILLAANGEVKLADLGIASAPDRTRITMEGAILGTLSYLAPEQLEGKPVTPATDVYGLAAVAYEALSGRKARPETNALALAHAVTTRPPPDLRAVWPEAPAAVAQLLSRGMSADPAVRPKAATELTRRLHDALELPPTVPHARPSTAPVAAPADRARRRAEVVQASRAAAARRAAAAAATAPAAAAAGAVAAGQPLRREPAKPERDRSDPAAVTFKQPRRRGLVLGLLLAGVLIAIAIAALLSPGTSHRTPAAAKQTQHRSASSSAAASRHGSSSAASTHSANTPTSASPPTTRASPAAPAVGQSNPGSAASSSAASSSTVAPAANTPIGAVEAFYSFAAAHRYPEAWALADPTFRAQLGGYRSFEYGQAPERSITFDSARVESQTRDSAVVAIRTTSVRTNGTQHCAGTVQLRPFNATWLLHLININCV